MNTREALERAAAWQFTYLTDADGEILPRFPERRSLAYVDELVGRLGRARRDTPRPEGCWCEGAGGTGGDFLPTTATFGQGQRRWREYCSCPDGQRVAALEGTAEAGVQAAYHAERAQATVAAVWGKAGVPTHFAGYTLDSYPVSPETAPVVATLRSWLDTDRWLLLHGPFGTGKSGLAIALLRAHVERGRAGLFVSAPELLDRIRRTYSADGQGGGEAREHDVIESLQAIDLLVVDDVGAERRSDWATEKLFSIVNYRHNWRKQTILTTNLTPAQLGEHLSARTFWRVVELCRTGEEATGAEYVLRLDGPNLRMGRPASAQEPGTTTADVPTEPDTLPGPGEPVTDAVLTHALGKFADAGEAIRQEWARLAAAHAWIDAPTFLWAVCRLAWDARDGAPPSAAAVLDACRHARDRRTHLNAGEPEEPSDREWVARLFRANAAGARGRAERRRVGPVSSVGTLVALRDLSAGRVA